LGIASGYVESDDVLVIVWDGPVSGAEWKQNVGERLEEDPAWPRGRRRLIDLTTLDPSEITASDIEVVIAFGRERIHHVAGRRQAVVAVLAWDPSALSASACRSPRVPHSSARPLDTQKTLLGTAPMPYA
jgi:hypothetical protein